MSLQVLYTRCAGLDVHKKTVVACVLLTAANGRLTKEICTFATTTSGLLTLRDLLGSHGVTHVTMESTGVYWRPVFNILEGSVEVILVNTQHIKALPGRKTDIRDSEWLADLLRHGLVRELHSSQAHSRSVRPGALSQVAGAQPYSAGQPCAKC
jgi:transposase